MAVSTPWCLMSKTYQRAGSFFRSSLFIAYPRGSFGQQCIGEKHPHACTNQALVYCQEMTKHHRKLKLALRVCPWRAMGIFRQFSQWWWAVWHKRDGARWVRAGTRIDHSGKKRWVRVGLRRRCQLIVRECKTRWQLTLMKLRYESMYSRPINQAFKVLALSWEYAVHWSKIKQQSDIIVGCAQPAVRNQGVKAVTQCPILEMVQTTRTPNPCYLLQSCCVYVVHCKAQFVGQTVAQVCVQN